MNVELTVDQLVIVLNALDLQQWEEGLDIDNRRMMSDEARKDIHALRAVLVAALIKVCGQQEQGGAGDMSNEEGEMKC
jgi:hypothetical protein